MKCRYICTVKTLVFATRMLLGSIPMRGTLAKLLLPWLALTNFLLLPRHCHYLKSALHVGMGSENLVSMEKWILK